MDLQRRYSPNAVTTLLSINAAVFIYTFFFGNMMDYAAYSWVHESFKLEMVFTHMFVHSGILHFAFNMLGLFMFGSLVEMRLGTGRFYMMYFLAGLFAYFLHCALGSPAGGMVGASGAIMGVLGAFVVLKPKEKIIFILLPFWPIEAWKLMCALMLIETVMGFTGVMSGIGHFAHVGGFIVGVSTMLILFEGHRYMLIHSIKVMLKRT